MQKLKSNESRPKFPGSCIKKRVHDCPLKNFVHLTGAYAGGGGCTGCTYTPHLNKKFRSDMPAKKNARSAQIRQN